MRRGKAINVGLRREDAAIDAMKPLGFPVDLVRRKLKQLLKTYGDEGWVFIEEASYKLLIEVILEEIQSEEQGEGATKLINYGDIAESSAAALEHVPDNTHLDDSVASNASPTKIDASHVSDAGLNKETGDERKCPTKKANVGDNYEYAGAAKSSCIAHASGIQDTVQCRAAGASGSRVGNPKEVPNTDNVAKQIGGDAETSGFQSLQSNDEPVKLSREISYGWFSNSEDEDVIDSRQFISLKQASSLLVETKNPRVTGMRWDLKPGGGCFLMFLYKFGSIVHNGLDLSRFLKLIFRKMAIHFLGN